MDLELNAAGVRRVLAADVGRVGLAADEDSGALGMKIILNRTNITRALSLNSKTHIFSNSA